MTRRVRNTSCCYMGQERTTEIPEIFRPEWIGRQLRMQGWLEETNGQRRVRLFGMSFRAFEIAQAFIAEVAGHLEKDGKTPRVFKLTELMGNGSNVGRKHNDRRPVVQSFHPYCACRLSELEPGFGFGADGLVEYVGIHE